MKPESDLQLELQTETVRTVAHWVAASRQVLDDSQALSAFINSRLLFFLKQYEEDQLLNGTGAGGELSGLMPQASAFTGSGAENALDQIRLAIAQVAVAGFSASAICLYPTDWATIELVKTDGSGEYMASGNPRAAGPPSLWGVPVIPTMAMAQGQFLVADTQNACELFDRQQSSVEISREHADFFTRNLVAILAEERLCLVTYRSTGLVKGGLIVPSP